MDLWAGFEQSRFVNGSGKLYVLSEDFSFRDYRPKKDDIFSDESEMIYLVSQL